MLPAALPLALAFGSMRLRLRISFGVFLLGGLSACVPPEPVEPVDTRPTLAVRVMHSYDSLPFDPQAALSDGAGNAIRFTTLKFIASGFVAENAEGDTVAEFPMSAMVEDPLLNYSHEKGIGRVPTTDVRRLRFILGLDSALNHANPLTLPYPLNAPGNHWDWNPAAGFKFLQLEGLVDVNGDGDFSDPEDESFVCHCATDALVRPLSLELEPELGQQVVRARLKVEWSTVLQGIDLLVAGTAMGKEAPCPQLMDNLVLAVSAE